ncbi:hypothetical protein HNO92_003907 [Chromobacterium alkanivorans]|uniref:nucleoside 2-deoxyribosyltransferase n=1 Tax=Chromobacterium alkanivorans TaxID=1071719 RepID=UPI0021672F70|nr:nucleoside 2-deoxyribosyltransferase [Chromobacterium alkanivorans]MCS3803957.1 hypothetical protein [Chromobacterium alkanivorans]MCS3817938.1 hypothetical protein [Chromobacterium alkanivorans]MCS3875558.1 hypothetical protein [Chromobacterium alkanivorans]
MNHSIAPHISPARTEGVSVFVGGPIQHALKKEGMTAEAASPIKAVHDVIHGMRLHLLSAHLAERFGQDSHNYSPTEVVLRDYDWMVQCSLFIAILPCDNQSQLIRTDGTHIELGWASALKKPILVLAQSHSHAQLSHLVKGLACVTQVKILNMGGILHNPQILQEAIQAQLPPANHAIGLSHLMNNPTL